MVNEGSGSEVQLTELLAQWRTGHQDAAARLLPHVHNELRRIAARQLRREANRSLLETSALVNEAYIRLAGSPPDVRDRSHFFSLAARLMRQILIDVARARQRNKRAGLRVSITAADREAPQQHADILALDQALQRLNQFDERKARVVEMRFFAGMEVNEIAEVMGVSENTIIRDWSIARAWLMKELS